MKIATSELEHLREEVKNCHRIIKDLQKKREFVGLTDEEKQEWIDAMPYDPQPRHCMILVNVIEVKLKDKNL